MGPGAMGPSDCHLIGSGGMGPGGGSGVGGGGEIAMDGGQHGGLEGSIKSSGSSLTPPPAGVGGYVCMYVYIYIYIYSVMYIHIYISSSFAGGAAFDVVNVSDFDGEFMGQMPKEQSKARREISGGGGVLG